MNRSIRRLGVFALLALVVGAGAGAAVLSAQPTDSALLPPLSAEYPFENIANPGIPTLQQIAAGATTDAQALAQIVAYFDAHEDWLRGTFAESDPARLRALYAMHVVHISHIYGEATIPPTLIDYLRTRRSHCGIYTRFQAQILDAFGLPWRIFGDSIAEHAWVEVKVDGNWEVFDSTVNVWLDQDGFELIDGAPRNFRLFYTPMNDPARPDAREHYWIGPAVNHRVGWYNMPRLRVWMTVLGLTYAPPTDLDDVAVAFSSPGEGSVNLTPWITT